MNQFFVFVEDCLLWDSRPRLVSRHFGVQSGEVVTNGCLVDILKDEQLKDEFHIHGSMVSGALS